MKWRLCHPNTNLMGRNFFFGDATGSKDPHLNESSECRVGASYESASQIRSSIFLHSAHSKRMCYTILIMHAYLGWYLIQSSTRIIISH